MKRKLLIFPPLLLVLVLLAFVKPVQTFALDALSIFRVNDVKTIEITVADLQEGAQNFASLKEKAKSLEGVETFDHSFIQVLAKEKPEVKTLASAKEFEAFRLRLPKELQAQTPTISAIDPHAINFSINTEATNEMLKAFTGSVLLPNTLNNVEMSMNIPAAALVTYPDVLFFATQKPALEAPTEAKEALREFSLQFPLIPSNLQQQLAAIDIESNDIYLPVLVGLGREIDLGGRIGYIYTMSDLQGFTQSLPTDLQQPTAQHDDMKHEFDKKHQAELSEEQLAAMEEMHEKFKEDMPNLENASVLIWTKDGVMYGLIGNQTDAALSKIARSVH